MASIASRAVLLLLLLLEILGMVEALGPGVVLGLNGALQRRIAFEAPVTLGAVNRAAESSSGVGGKGQGAFLAAVACGAEASLAMFFGGDEGDAMAGALRAQCGGGADEGLWVRTASATRICTTLVAPDGDATEIVEPSGAVAGDEVDALTSALKRRAPAGGVLVCGSVPPGVPGATYYGACVEAVAGPGARILVDSVVGVEATLAAAAANACDAALKLNARELLAVAGDPVDAAAADGVADPARVGRAAAAVAAALDPGQTCLAAVLWTDGAHPAGAFVPSTGATFELALPPLPGPVLSPIGAGDAVAGATFAAWLNAADRADGADGDVPAPVAAFARGLSVGAASCLTRENAAFDAAVAAELHAGVAISAATS